MADTGWTFPSTGATATPGNDTWSNPGNVTADDTQVADVTASDGSPDTRWLQGYNYGFSTAIPANNEIDGIEVQLLDFYRSGGTSYEWNNPGCNLRLADASIGTQGRQGDLNPITNTPTTSDTAGSPSQLWGETLSRTDVIDSDFGFCIKLDHPNPSGGEGFQVDAFRMKIYYSPSVVITDVDTDEIWEDGDTGLVITGTGFT